LENAFENEGQEFKILFDILPNRECFYKQIGLIQKQCRGDEERIVTHCDSESSMIKCSSDLVQ
jgi:hypothetical protein